MAATAIANPVLNQVVADLAFVYEAKNVSGTYTAKAIPVLSGTINFDTGGVTTTEVKLTTKQVATATVDKDDSDISYDEVVSLANGADVTDQLTADKVEDTDVYLVTRSKNAYIKIIDATVASSYQMSDDGVLVKHKVITPSSQGIQIIVAASGSSVTIPDADEA